jgi:heme-degrading monooxygenase HmoA
MISRQWKGIARPSEASNYIRHLREDTFPKLTQLPGFLRANILRRDVAEGVEFLIVTEWESRDVIRAFTGEDIARAVVPDVVQAMMVRFDKEVAHYELVDRFGAPHS